MKLKLKVPRLSNLSLRTRLSLAGGVFGALLVSMVTGIGVIAAIAGVIIGGFVFMTTNP